ncbi:MAG: hypothetical protein D4R84_01805 [Rhodocyclaceae bacterium]|nr:MAG: hypothetical protein D4R84_01805 [Rhodocyclaceae bacterium]
MKINVEYKDRQGNLEIRKLRMSLPAFLKHAAIAGQGPRLGILPSLARGLGVLMLYGRYIDAPCWSEWSGFKKAGLQFADPTEQGDFSTLAGKALADFLAKQLLGAKFTHTYEAAMHVRGLPIPGPRPDFYCTTPTQQFSIEAKGYAQRTVSDAEMKLHKAQSHAGPIPVNFSVASVAYNIYDVLQCKFHDPVGEDVEFSRRENNALAKQYYRNLHVGLSEHLTPESIKYEDRQFDGYDISPYLFTGRRNRPVTLLFDSRIMGNIERENILEDEYSRIDEGEIYADVDGIGMRVG